MSLTTAADRLKKVMRIALVGIRPADQVILKGYLRILLRLEADLEWVSANHQEIDLFMINSDFQQSESVQRLLAHKPDSAILYISRAEGEEGSLEGNALQLPLKDLDPLNTWFYHNLSFLSVNTLKPAAAPSAAMNDKTETQSTPSQPPRRQSIDDILASRAAQGIGTPAQAPSAIQTASQPLSAKPTVDQTALLSIAKVILQLQRREDSVFSLTDTQGTPLAYIQPKQQRVWPVATSITTKNGWLLSGNTAAPVMDNAQSLDLVQWLWQLANQGSLFFQKLIHPEQRYHLTSWAKPIEGNHRHDQLKCQCILEARQVTVQELATLAQVSVSDAEKTVIGLMVAGLMSLDVYKSLPTIVKQAATAQPAPVTHVATNTPTTAPTQAMPTSHATQAVNQEVNANQAATNNGDNGMMGFLSRLRRKLGI